MLEGFSQHPIGFLAVLAASKPRSQEVEFQQGCMELGSMHQCPLQQRSWAAGRLTAVHCGCSGGQRMNEFTVGLGGLYTSLDLPEGSWGWPEASWDWPEASLDWPKASLNGRRPFFRLAEGQCSSFPQELDSDSVRRTLHLSSFIKCTTLRF